MRPSILIVDDEEKLAESLAQLLKLKGFSCDISHGGHQAYEMAKDGHYQLVLSDICMPNGDGIELAHRLTRNLSNSPKVILLSGFSERIDSVKEDPAVFSFFHKPYSFADLLEKVSPLIEKQEV